MRDKNKRPIKRAKRKLSQMMIEHYLVDQTLVLKRQDHPSAQTKVPNSP
jgi:hypothetical protein